MRSAANVMSEIELLVGRYKVKQIDVLDDNFTLDVGRAEKIFDEIVKRKISVLFNFQNGIRADRLTLRLVKKMKLAGVYKTGIGIESGDPQIQKIIKKSLSLAKVIRAVKMLRREGIIVVGFFMIGIPGENLATIEKTIKFAIKVNPHIANFSIVVPLPQTELFEMVKNGGKFLTPLHQGSNTGYYSGDFSFTYGDLNPEFIRKYAASAYRKFYFRPAKIFDIMTSIKSMGELRWIVDTAKPLVRFLCS
jgi:anaerobic magnesium-protoporphyrin IX monomethyl ester cyclase